MAVLLRGRPRNEARQNLQTPKQTITKVAQTFQTRTKCAVLHISKDALIPPSNHIINNCPLSIATTQRDLEMLLSSNLSWSDHYNCICSKAYRALNLIRRTIPARFSLLIKKALYLSLIHSNLSYCSQIWRPFKLKDIQQLRRCARRATTYHTNH